MIKKKIIFYLPTLNVGGAERVTINILRYLDASKYEIHLVLVSKMGNFLDLVPSYVSIHDLGAGKTINSIFKLRQIIQKLKPDIVYSTLLRTHISLYFSTLMMKKKLKTIMRMPSSPKMMIKNKKFGLLFRYFLEKSLKNASLVIAQTPNMKDEIIEYHKVVEENIVVVINLLDTDLIEKSIINIENPFDPNYINVIASGSIRPVKGFDVLIRAFLKVYTRNKRFRLFILGNDNNNTLKEYKKIRKELGLDEVISFLGYQKNPYKYYYYSDLFVLSSRYEGLPNVVLENLYLEKPVVATRCMPFMNIIIEDKKNGLLVEVEDEEALSEAILNYQKIEKPTLFKMDQYSSIDDIFHV